MFVLYDVFWLLVDDREVVHVQEYGSVVLWIDLCYCFVFALYNLVLGTMFLKSRFLEVFRKNRILIFCVIILLNNTVLAFVVEHVIERYFTYGSIWAMWDNIYLMGVLSTLQALVVASEYYFREMETVNEENRLLELRLLKMQLAPHFIFNSLSIMAGLIEENTEKAEEYLMRLSRIYRYVLEHIESDMVPVEEALGVLDDYAAMLQLRHPNVELVVKHVEWDGKDCVLSQGLQLLMENAVKHNALNQGKVLTVTIDREGDMLTVSNNIITSRYAGVRMVASHKLGLETLAARYRMKYGLKMRVVQDKETFKVCLPLICRKKR